MDKIQRSQFRPPDDLRQIVREVKRELSTRTIASKQTRNYTVHCANGDRVDVQETTHVWVEEVFE